MLGGADQRRCIEPLGGGRTRCCLERAVKRTADPAVRPAGAGHQPDVDVLREGRRIVEAQKRDRLARWVGCGPEVVAGGGGERGDLARERHAVQISTEVEVPGVVARRRCHDSGGIMRPRNARVLELAGRQVSRRAGTVGRDHIDVRRTVVDPPFAIEHREEALDLAWCLPALVTFLGAGSVVTLVWCATEEGDPFPVRAECDLAKAVAHRRHGACLADGADGQGMQRALVLLGTAP